MQLKLVSFVILVTDVQNLTLPEVNFICTHIGLHSLDTFSFYIYVLGFYVSCFFQVVCDHFSPQFLSFVALSNVMFWWTFQPNIYAGWLGNMKLTIQRKFLSRDDIIILSFSIIDQPQVFRI